MKYLFFLLSFGLTISVCAQQRKIHTKKKATFLIASRDSIKKWGYDLELLAFSGDVFHDEVVLHAGKIYHDTTDSYIRKRLIAVGDSSILKKYYDTSQVVLMINISGTINKITALKITDRSQYYTFRIYMDPVTKKEFVDNNGWGQPVSNDYDWPHTYRTISNTPWPDSIIIIGEIK